MNHIAAITALRQAIEQEEQVQPVAWRAIDANGRWMYGDLPVPDLPLDNAELLCVHTAPPPRQPWVDAQIRGEAAKAVFDALWRAVPGLGPWSAFDADEVQSMADALKPFVTAPQLRQPLTEEQIKRIYARYGGDMINCARAIERAAHRNKDKK